MEPWHVVTARDEHSTWQDNERVRQVVTGHLGHS